SDPDHEESEACPVENNESGALRRASQGRYLRMSHFGKFSWSSLSPASVTLVKPRSSPRGTPSADDAQGDIRHQVEQQYSYLVNRHTSIVKGVELITGDAEPPAV